MRLDPLAALPKTCQLGIQAVADRHERELLEEALRQRPGDFEVLVRLGELYPRLGMSKAALAIDLKLVEMAPQDPIVRYNLACSLTLNGDLQAAFGALREAIRLGYSDVDHLKKDDDLARLRADPLFQDLLRLLRRKAGRARRSREEDLS